MFEPTIPFGEPELLRASAFQRYLHEPGGPRALGAVVETVTRPVGLSASLLADLSRFEGPGHSSEVLEVLAACVRHAQEVVVHLQMAELVVPLTVFAIERLAHCPISLDALLRERPTELRVLHVEPAVLRPPGHPDTALVADQQHCHPLGPMLWEFALRGSRATLLPEIAGPVAYRVAPGIELGDLRVAGALASTIQRLQRNSVSLRELADWPGLDGARAARLLNALYLQSGLIISRTHRAASDSWFGVLSR